MSVLFILLKLAQLCVIIFQRILVYYFSGSESEMDQHIGTIVCHVAEATEWKTQWQ